MSNLKPYDVETILRRVLKKIRVSVLDRETSTAESAEQTTLLNNQMINSYWKKGPVQQVAPDVSKPPDASNLENSKIPIKKERLDGTEENSAIKKLSNTNRNTSVLEESNGLAIEDMSDDENESILDVLTGNLEEFGEFRQEGGIFKEDDSKLRLCKRPVGSSLNDLDCVSDEEFPEQKSQANLESIDSSEDENMDEDSASFVDEFCGVGVTSGAVSWLACHCNGDVRLAVNSLQSALVKASKQVYLTREKYSLKQWVEKTGEKSSKEPSPGLVTDDISSDEENVEAKQFPPVNIQTNEAPQQQLDNISDVSDSSVNDETQISRCRKKGVHSELDSDDVFSDAMSPEDALDYGEIEEEAPPEASEDSPATDTQDEGDGQFNGKVISGRPSTMIFAKENQRAPQPDHIPNTGLKTVNQTLVSKNILSPVLPDVAVGPGTATEENTDKKLDARKPWRASRIVAVVTIQDFKNIMQVGI